MIELKNLTFAYPGQSPLYEDFSLEIPRGDAWSVIGPSGCGKTTFLYLLAGLIRPLAGCIRIDGQTVYRPRPASGLVLQDHGLLPWATVYENARLGFAIRRFYGNDGRHTPKDALVDDAQARRQVDFWLDRLGIGKLRTKYPGQLSGGQRQRTAIARTLVLNPDVLLLDEPFSALDAPTREDLQRAIVSIQTESRNRMTRIIVTHDIEVAAEMGQKILILGSGCNRNPQVIANDCAGLGANKDRERFRTRCRHLRAMLGELV